MMETVLKKIGPYYYDPEQLVGKGAFAKVYRARDERNQIEVALKVIPVQNILRDQDEAVLLEREINILKQIEGRHVVKFFEVLRTPNNLYVATEYCNGGDLQKKINEKYSFTEEEACSIIKQVAAAFITVEDSNPVNHENQPVKIMHRDIKPANILFHDGSVKVADFGFAKLVEDVDKEKKKGHTPGIGTPFYMSPELLDDQEYSVKCDIWSAGMVFYQMLFGKLPWTASSITKLFDNITKKPLEFPKPIKEGTKDLLTKMLSVDESERANWRQVFEHPALSSFNYANEHRQNPGLRFQNFDLPAENAMSMNAFRPVGTSEKRESVDNKIEKEIREEEKASSQKETKVSTIFVLGLIGLFIFLLVSRFISSGKREK